MNLEQLRKALAEKVKGLDALKTKAFADGATKEDADALQRAITEIKEIEATIKLAEETEEIILRSSRPANDPADDRTPAQAKHPETSAQKIGTIIGGMLKVYRETGMKGPKATIEGIRQLGHDGLADEVAREQRAMNSVNGAAGGIVIGENFAPDILPLLYPMSSFMAGNPIEVPMPQGSFRQSAGATGATASYRAEGADITVSQPTFRDFRMTAHLLSGIVPITNQLIRYSLGAAETFARGDLAQAMSTKLDSVAYLGTGVNDDPTGILNLPGTYSTPATNSTTPTQAQVDSDARKLLTRFTRYPLLLQGLEWRMSVLTAAYVADMTDGNGNYIYPEMRSKTPMFKGYPVRIAGNFPENLGGGTNETYLALIAFGHTLYGNAKGLELAISSEASIAAGQNGALVSMFSTDSTAIRATMEHDITTRYVEAVAYLSAVKWGR